jgi:hypothetical protein
MAKGVEGAIATPALWYPGQSQEETKHEVHLMVQRSVATRAFLDGELDFCTFLDVLESANMDMDGMIEGWSEELVLV